MDPKEYDLAYFKSAGFSRRTCPKCGRSYWSQGDHATCGEPPCAEYSFFAKSPMNRPLGIHDVREAYLSFFERHGHGRVPRYPITARWRDDVFFTQASIYDFQPWVINGVVEPPHNPLTISQTCVRFNDIDNVGRTGRHFTMFEMMAHHAFNKKDHLIYFKDRTVELCHELLTKDLGIDPKLPTYIEEWWEGGGNSGPCFETIVCGVELATLVFMMYEETPAGRKDMPMQVVDTGYGLERFAWVSQAAPNAYEAVFPELCQRIRGELGIPIDRDLLVSFSRLTSATDLKKQGALRAIREMLAKETGKTFDEVVAALRPLELIYTLLDHTRALMFLLNDGVVPSNVKDGYFARLLARRSLRAIEGLGLKHSLSEVVDWQIGQYGKRFPELAENRDTILNLARVEESKFERTLDKGRALVEKLEKDGKLDVDALVELYDSHGLDPETVVSFSKTKPAVPDDFYARVAARHDNPKAEREAVARVIPGGPTKLLFYDSPRQCDFTAHVTAVLPEGVVLDRTCFYPEGGGQESDTGTLDDHKVGFVEKIGATALHRIEDGWRPAVGDEVRGVVDVARRMQLTRHHTATHIVNAAARRVLGKHVMQTGAHKSEEMARLDITHYEGIPHDKLMEIERIANEIALEDRAIDATFMHRGEAEGKYGFTLYQGGAVPGRDIRVVKIEGWDVEACGGTHLERTGQVGYVKMLRAKRIQDGVVRLEFAAGTAAARAVRDIDSDLEGAARELSSGKGDVPKAVAALKAELEKEKSRANALEAASKKGEVASLLQTGESAGGVSVLVKTAPGGPGELVKLGKEVMAKADGPAVVLLGAEGTAALLFMSKDAPRVNLGHVIGSVAGHIGGKGGGRADYAQAGGTDPAGVSKALGEAKRLVLEALSG